MYVCVRERERERNGVRVLLPCIFVRVACEYIYILFGFALLVF